MNPSRTYLAVWASLLVATAAAGAERPAFDPPDKPPARATGQDYKVAVRLRAELLRKVPALKNPTVEYAGGVVTLSGPMPSAEVGAEAVRLLRSMHAVAKVDEAGLYLDDRLAPPALPLARLGPAPEPPGPVLPPPPQHVVAKPTEAPPAVRPTPAPAPRKVPAVSVSRSLSERVREAVGRGGFASLRVKVNEAKGEAEYDSRGLSREDRDRVYRILSEAGVKEVVENDD